MRRAVLFLPALLLALIRDAQMPAAGVDLSPDETAAARKLYIAKCAKCHKLYDPSRYSDAKWHDWMEKMSRKAKLKPDQKELLSRYLDNTYRGGPKTNTPPAAPNSIH